MDLRSMLNNDPPPATSPAQNRPLRPPPPPTPQRSIQDPRFQHTPPQAQSSYQSPGPSRYETTPQRYHTPSSSGYPFPPQQSPHAQQPQQQPQYLQHQHQAYVSPTTTPRGTPHPLSAHSNTRSNTSSNIVSPSSHGHIPSQTSPQQYGHQAQTPQIHSPHYGQQQQHHHHHQQQQQQQQQQQYSGYPRQAPVESRPYQQIERHAPSIATPVPRDRSTPRHHHDRDVSVSPKTKIPYLPQEERVGVKREAEQSVEEIHLQSRPQQVLQSTPLRPPPQSVHDQSPNHSRHESISIRSIDMMEVEHSNGANERQWSSPSSDRAKVNGSEIRDGQGQGQLPPQQPHSTANLVHTPTTTSVRGITPKDPNHQQPQPQPLQRQQQQQQQPSQNKEPHTRPLVPPTTATSHRSTPTASSPAYSRTSQTLASPSPKPSQQALQPPRRLSIVSTNHPMDPKRSTSSPSASGRPPKKRTRYDEPPIWARKASEVNRSNNGSIYNNRPSQDSFTSSATPNHSAVTAGGPPPQQPIDRPQQRPPSPRPPPSSGNDARMIAPGYGPWEECLTGIRQMDDVTKHVADFLFRNVVMQNDPDLVRGGPNDPVIEIEAKLGHIICKETDDRFSLPVLTETVFDSERMQQFMRFRSSMTEPQHKILNGFLNWSVGKANNSGGRVKMAYVHTREQDTFYELPQDQYSMLPQSILDTLKPHNRIRVRVTKDQQTGKVLKKIIKTRIADMNVLSPRNAHDWRISVNMEMPYPGDIEELQPVGDAAGDRNKDRLSYKHLCYQVDLTQVTDGNGKKEHELEVEVDGHKIREHGLLLQKNQNNSYEMIVRGFVDNVRLLLRQSPQK